MDGDEGFEAACGAAGGGECESLAEWTKELPAKCVPVASCNPLPFSLGIYQ